VVAFEVVEPEVLDLGDGLLAVGVALVGDDRGVAVVGYLVRVVGSTAARTSVGSPTSTYGRPFS